MIISATIQNAINEQIKREFTASYLYLSMSAYCDRENFSGFARWFRLQSQEEYGHGMKLFDFLSQSNGEVELGAIDAPANQWGSILRVFEDALKSEEGTSTHLHDLYELAGKERAYAVQVQLQWFLTEQIEEENTTRNILSKLRLIESNPAALLELDRQMGQRTTSE